MRVPIINKKMSSYEQFIAANEKLFKCMEDA